MSYGPFVNEDGSVISSALQIGEGMQADEDLYRNFSIELGQIEAIYTIDDSKNMVDESAGISTRYDVRVFSSNGHSELIYRCRAVQPLFGGGLNNFFEVLPTDPGTKGKDKTERRDLRRGHMVLVGFLGGQKTEGVILGSMPHESEVAQAARPKKGKGVYTEGEIQGLNFQIDNDGALTITFNGPKDDEGKPADDKLGPTVIQIAKTGSVIIKTNEDAGQIVEIDREKKTITLTNGKDQIVKMDQEAAKIQVQAKTIEIGKENLQPAVVGDDWKKLMESLIEAINTHTHPTGVGPSGTPINAPKFAQVKSQLKDALSKNHKIEK